MITIGLFSLYPQAEEIDMAEDAINYYGSNGEYRPFDSHFLRIISVYNLEGERTIEYSRQLNRLTQLNSSNSTKTERYEATHI